MKTHAFYIALILIICTLGWFTFERQAEKIRYQGTTISGLIADTTEKANRLILGKKELDKFSPKTADKVKAHEKRTGAKVKQVHAMAFPIVSSVPDTVFVPVEIVRDPYDWCFKPQIWEFQHGGITSLVSYDPYNNGITDSLFGTLEVDVYADRDRIRWIIFKPQYWFGERPIAIRVENNLGLQIKENTIFEIQ